MMLEVSEMIDEQIFIDVKVHNPTKEVGSYISYEIVIETNDPSFSFQKSTTRRRYSEFFTLKKLLSKQFPQYKLPLLPPKEPFKDSFDRNFIKERQEGLQDFLKKLVSDRLYLSSKALHLFLQSTFSMPNIKDVVEGKTPAIEVQAALSNFYDSYSTVEDGTNSHASSDCLSDESSSSACAVIKPSSESNMNAALEHKRVSFCDKVTVAEVHIT